MCPTALHPRHILWLSGVFDNCPSLSTRTVLLLTISSAVVSYSMDVTTVTSISPGPRLGKVGSDSDDCNWCDWPLKLLTNSKFVICPTYFLGGWLGLLHLFLSVFGFVRSFDLWPVFVGMGSDQM